MIIFLYFVLLAAFLFLEKLVSENARYRGLILGLVVFVLGYLICPQLKYIGIILCGINMAKTCIVELKSLELTTVKSK